MQRDTRKKYYELHSWVGVITAVLLFVIAFTGAVSVFGRPELKIWANPEIRGLIDVQRAEVVELVERYAQQVPPTYLDEIRILLPQVNSWPRLIIFFEGHVTGEDGVEQHRAHWFEFHPKTLALLRQQEGEIGELFASQPEDMADFIVDFHADLHLGRPLGLILTGLLGLTLLASIVTGILIHKKILKDLFTFRPFRSVRLLWRDTHTAISVWGVVFHATIAFTGAFLGLVTVLLLPAAAFVSFGGDMEKLEQTLLPELEPVLSGQSAPTPLLSIWDKAVSEHPQHQFFSATIFAWGDRNAEIYFDVMSDRVLGGQKLHYRVADAAQMPTLTTFERLGGVSGVLVDMIFPLHFGNFGGVLVKVVWALLGVGTTLAAVSGMMIWVERRAYGSHGQLSLARYELISRLSLGACLGVVLATVALFHAQLWFDHLQRSAEFGWVFFSLWLLSIVFAYYMDSDVQVAKLLFWMIGLCGLAVAPVNGTLTGQHVFNALTQGHTVSALVDLVLGGLGLILIISAWRLPQQRFAQVEAAVVDEPQRLEVDW